MSARSLFPVGSEITTRPGWKRCLLLAVLTALVLLLFASVVRAPDGAQCGRQSPPAAAPLFLG